MLQRHKIPTIFNIYMLDVICCALGCVILLWQVSHQEAVEQTVAAKEAHADAVKQSTDAHAARKKAEKTTIDLLAVSSEASEWREKHERLTVAFELLRRDWEDAVKLASERQQALDKIRTALALSDEQLKKLEAEQKKTNVDLAGAKKVNVDLLAKIAALKSDIAVRQKEADEQLSAIKLSDENVRKLQKLLDSLQVDVQNAQARVKTTELQLKMREQDGKEITSLKSMVAALLTERDSFKQKAADGTKERAALAQRVAALQAEADQRFAGIPLTGENVVFLIDISGSMVMKDENEPDPDKWPFLCDTLMKLMKSVPTMQRFQIILFSDKTSYLFGNRDVWLKYEGPKTAEMARDALRKVKVEGGTNMHDAFDEAFRYRKIKLDTIYLFSDGLPNVGEGLPDNLRNASEAQRNQHLSKYVRDKLKNEWNHKQAGLNDVRINAVGFFFESPDVGAFLWALAREHRGSFVGLR
jgi:VWA domain-containing protein